MVAVALLSDGFRSMTCGITVTSVEISPLTDGADSVRSKLTSSPALKLKASLLQVTIEPRLLQSQPLPNEIAIRATPAGRPILTVVFGEVSGPEFLAVTV